MTIESLRFLGFMDFRTTFTTVNKAIKYEGGLISLFRKIFKVLGEEGFSGFLYRIRFLRFNYVQPYLYREPDLSESTMKRIESFEYKPKISVVMPVYNVDRRWLLAAVDSVLAQWYTNWELCICDDHSTRNETLEALKEVVEKDDRIRIVYSEENGNISAASNAAFKLVTGDYVALMDNDDELTIDALYEVVRCLQQKRYDFIYSDEDKIEFDGKFVEPHIKPDFSAELLLCHNYMSHLGVINRKLIEMVGGWTIGLEGAQDYDLYLRVLEQTDLVCHIPRVLYHWRKLPGSTAAEFSEKSYAQEAGRRSVELAIARRGIDATVENGLTSGTYRVKYATKGDS